MAEVVQGECVGASASDLGVLERVLPNAPETPHYEKSSRGGELHARLATRNLCRRNELGVVDGAYYVRSSVDGADWGSLAASGADERAARAVLRRGAGVALDYVHRGSMTRDGRWGCASRRLSAESAAVEGREVNSSPELRHPQGELLREQTVRGGQRLVAE